MGAHCEGQREVHMSVVARRPHRATRLVGVAAIGALLIATAACSSDDDDRRRGSTAAATSTAAAESTTTTAVAAETTDASATRRPSSTTSASTSSSSAVAPTTAPSGAPCVPTSRHPLPGQRQVSLAPLPADLVAKLDAAAQSSFQEAAAPGAIVGVRTPQGTWTKAYGVADPCDRGADGGRHAHPHRLGHQDVHRHGDHAAGRSRARCRSTTRSTSTCRTSRTATGSRCACSPT